MEPLALVLVGAAIWAYGWNHLRLLRDSKTTGVISLAVAVALLALVVLKPVGSVLVTPAALAIDGDVGETLAGVNIFVLMAALWALIVAANDLWGFETRSLGLFSIAAAVGYVVLALFFMNGNLDPNRWTEAVTPSALMGVASLALAVITGLVFFYTVPPFPKVRVVTASFSLGVGAILGLIGILHVLGLLNLVG
ncbi:MAG: hypothetical protein HYU29_04155 [Chloroflexi bacterium]|nr:hypothetical protein [Chloroflexota bacterium]